MGFLAVSGLIAPSPSKKATPVRLIAPSSPEFPILVIAKKFRQKVQHNNFCQRPFLTNPPFKVSSLYKDLIREKVVNMAYFSKLGVGGYSHRDTCSEMEAVAL